MRSQIGRGRAGESRHRLVWKRLLRVVALLAAGGGWAMRVTVGPAGDLQDGSGGGAPQRAFRQRLQGCDCLGLPLSVISAPLPSQSSPLPLGFRYLP